MKRILSAILVLILCLSLCACSGVTQEVYDAAKAGYDELSSKYDALKSKVEKYSTVIDALEKEDYDGAVEAVNAMRPAPKVTEVEITMDNLWDYFEIVEKRDERTDAQGNLIAVYVANLISPKNGLILADQEKYHTDVAIGFEYDRKTQVFTQPCTIDFVNYSCTGSVIDNQYQHKSEMAHFPQSPSLCTIQANYQDSDFAIIGIFENFEILNASGTLYLVNK